MRWVGQFVENGLAAMFERIFDLSTVSREDLRASLLSVKILTILCQIAMAVVFAFLLWREVENPQIAGWIRFYDESLFGANPTV